MKKIFRLALHPVPELEHFDTSLRYTDILFGFVIRELFSRLQNWNQIDRAVQLHLIVGTTLVLGSWIGFRRSLYRTTFQVKFFNLPLIRFVVDQLMLVLYFRVAVLTDVGGKQIPPPDDLANSTSELVMYVFFLYTIWDLLGMWMAKARTIASDGTEKPRYPEITNSKDPKMTDKAQTINWRGFLITIGSTGLLLFVWSLRCRLSPNWRFFIVTALLLLYRWAKEMRTSWLSPLSG
jgi:hypothetical protein